MYRIQAAVSLKTIRENAKTIKCRAGTDLIAVVKDDGYGHGAAHVAHALSGIASAFAVASVEEGAALRCAGIGEDILVLTPCLSVEEGVRLIEYQLIASVPSLASFRLLLCAEAIAMRRTRVHLAVNTGMNRYGVRPERVASLCKEAGGRVEGMYSHLYAADDKQSVSEQRALFERAADTVKALCPSAVCHLSATGGALQALSYNAVRAGIALYGYLPAGFEGDLAVKPAMKVYATVSHRTRQIGRGAGYERSEGEYGRMHTLRLGYGDGFFRREGLGIGNLCMDACVCEGDAPFGERRLVMKDVSAYARAHGTSEYEVLLRIGAHAEKIYYG